MNRVALPRFTLQRKIFHAAISYRAVTEGQSGNNLSFEICEKIRTLSLEGDCHIDTDAPQSARTKLPRCAQKPAPYQTKQAKVFLDTECLLDCYDWEAGFIQGLCSSIVMVCLLSFDKYGRGSVGDLTTLCPLEGKDRVDNVLLELIVGQELRAFGEKTSLRAILPILVGPQRPDTSFEPFPMGVLELLSQDPSVMTNNRAASILAMLGVGDKQIQAMQARSVRQHVDLVLKNQGVQASSYASQKDLVRESAHRCLMVIDREILEIRMLPAFFVSNRPGGQEVLDWLRERQLGSYLPIFVRNGLYTLLQVSNLSREQVARLANEYIAYQRVNVALEKGASTVQVQESTATLPPIIKERDVSIQAELSLWQDIKDLVNNPRARSMAWQLELFEDSAGDWITLGENKTKSSPVQGHPSPKKCANMFLTLTFNLLECICRMGKKLS
jgi:hypothetical protein